MVLTRTLYGEEAAKRPDLLPDQDKERIRTLSSAVAAVVGGAVGGSGGSNAADVLSNAQIGGVVGRNAVENNWLKREEVDRLISLEKACNGGAGLEQACVERDRLKELDQHRDIRLLVACENPQSAECRTLRHQAILSTGRLRVGYAGQMGMSPEAKDAHNKEYSSTDAVVQLASGRTPEQIAADVQLTRAVQRFIVDLTFIGTINDFKEADTVSEYAVATILAMPGLRQADKVRHVGDFRKAYIAAKEAGDLNAAKELLNLAREAQRSPNRLSQLAVAEAKIHAREVIQHLQIDNKIANQMRSRGWTRQDIEALIQKGRTGTSVDRRSPAKTLDNLGRNDPADVYGNAKEHVVINRRTGEVTQVSDKTISEWVPDSRIKFFNEK